MIPSILWPPSKCEKIVGSLHHLEFEHPQANLFLSWLLNMCIVDRRKDIFVHSSSMTCAVDIYLGMPWSTRLTQKSGCLEASVALERQLQEDTVLSTTEVRCVTCIVLLFYALLLVDLGWQSFIIHSLVDLLLLESCWSFGAGQQ